MHVEMNPAAGEMLLRHVGDRLRFTIKPERAVPQAFLRTNLGRGAVLDGETVREYRRELARWGVLAPEELGMTPPGQAWRDIPMQLRDGTWEAEVTLTEAGFFNIKGYVVDEHGRQAWPGGSDIPVTVHPSEFRTGNTIYCAFTRMFGEGKAAVSTKPADDPLLASLDQQGYAVIPSSGKFRDLIREVPHIFGTLGCRILHLLPVNPTPTTYARFGRFGSPYACEDLMMVDPALVEFDQRTTGIEQFEELTYAAHQYGGQVILDIVINHTGWGSTLQENHPDWFVRKDDGKFASPGAWGTVWEDLVELDHRAPLSWDYLADVFITWCRRGVDGFRCDAGYKVPVAAWRYITARVRHEFPKALFLLEGLGGAWEATEQLLTRGGMQWAYSELFQNHTPLQVSGYMDHSIRASKSAGVLVHYSETHDNDRLAAKGRTWSLMRNQLCALLSHAGGYGITCGVEWLAAVKVNVHSSRGMAWGSEANIVPEIARLNQLLREHPCFFDGAELRRLSPAESPVFALERRSAEGLDQLLVLANLNPEEAHTFPIPNDVYEELGRPAFDLLTRKKIQTVDEASEVVLRLEAGESLCLAVDERIHGLHGDDYRRLRGRHAWAIEVLAHVLEPEEIGPHSWRELADRVQLSPKKFLASLPAISRERAREDLGAALTAAAEARVYPRVVEWSMIDRRRVLPVPPEHWILITDEVAFRVTLVWKGERESSSVPVELQQHAVSLAINGRHFAAIPPRDIFKRQRTGNAELKLVRFGTSTVECTGSLLFLKDEPEHDANLRLPLAGPTTAAEDPLVLLTNGRGGMARMCVDLGRVKSKYDCVLGANLHPSIPVDRHIFVKRARFWANADRFITALSAENLQAFQPGPPARWEFAAIAGGGETARIEVIADMLDGQNTTIFSLRLLESSKPGTDVRITARFDIEDRNFHTQTNRNSGSEFHFAAHVRELEDRAGFEFRPAGDRHVRIVSTAGRYHSGPEWSTDIPHSIEQTRGHAGGGDAYSPGWFDIPLERGVAIQIVVTAEGADPSPALLERFIAAREAQNETACARAELPGEFSRQLAIATQAFVVRRDEFKTIIAGYPWFLDWGRDSLICARGLLSAGLADEVRELLITFGRFEKDGTLPNTIHGADASNRDTSDAPLWYGVVCEELAEITGSSVYDTPVDSAGRPIRDVLRGIAQGCVRGTPNGIRMDAETALLWSPSHFTWMDTNYPAGTPREGYPIEIQALWIRLLEQLDRLRMPATGEAWGELAARARRSILELFWKEELGWYSDVLAGPAGTSARAATPDDALRSNCVIPLALGMVPQERARRCLENVLRYLVIPGGLRSLAPLPVKHPLPIHAADWRLLNNPHEPYWGRYEGDEDTQRKPAYHNGTAWAWTFPGLCEAIARAWDFSPEAVQAAKALLGSMDATLNNGCLGQIPEVLDGDAPHLPRGCDAQAWSVTEALRVWKLLNGRGL